MTTRSHLGERPGFAGSPPAVAACFAVPPNTRGLRRQTLETFAVQGEAEGFSGLSEDIPNYRRVHDIAAKALRLLGVSEPALALLGYLFNWTQPQDWKAGSRPIAYPSNDTVCDDHGLSDASLRRHVMELRQAGAITMKDSGNNKRHGRRDSEGRIILGSTFGYDLSPLAMRQAHYQDIVKAHKSDCALRKDARRTAKIASRALQQLIESADEWKLLSAYWEALPQRLADLGEQMDQAVSTAALTDVAHRFELLRADALADFNRASAERTKGQQKPAAEAGGVNWEHAALAENNKECVSGRPLKSERLYNTTNTHLIENVQAWRQEVTGCSGTFPDSQPPVEVADEEAAEPWTKEPWDGGEFHIDEVRTSPQELAELVPVLGRQITGVVTWENLIGVCTGWAQQHGISPALLKQLLRAIGWQPTYIAIAILAAKKSGHFDVSAGAYLTGMLKRAKSGELNLRNSLFGLRKDAPDVAARHKALRRRRRPLPALPTQQAADIKPVMPAALAAQLHKFAQRIDTVVPLPPVEVPPTPMSDAAIRQMIENKAAEARVRQAARLSAMTPEQRADAEEQARLKAEFLRRSRMKIAIGGTT
jgi:replication initiation protein RepC